MPIEEKPRALEFTFVPENDSGSRYEITYDSQCQVPIEVSYNGTKLLMPVELFVEVVDFLNQKGVIKTGQNNPPSGESRESRVNRPKVIPLPVIDGQETVIQKEEEPKTIIQTNPITSFSESTVEEEILKEIVEENTPEENIIFEEEDKKDETIPKRTVIKTRIKDDGDPLQAEREAAEIRGKKESNFRRKE